MDSTVGIAALHEHLQRNPEAQRAALHDPEFAAETHRLRIVLGHLDAALVAEGMDEDARHRVASCVATRSLGTDESNARMAERARVVQELLADAKIHVPAEW